MAIKDDELDRMFDWARTALRESGREAIAIELLSAYVSQRPLDNYARYLLGDALRAVGRVAEAEHALLQSLSEASEKSRARIMAALGMLKARHGSLDAAEEWFRRATSDDVGRDKGWMWIMRGSNLAVAGRFDEAAECHLRAAQLPGDPDEALLNLGYVRRAQGRYADAIDAFRKALEITPDYPEAKTALEGLGEIFSAMELAASVGSS